MESARPRAEAPGSASLALFLFLFLAGSLSSTILLKVGEIQYLEIIYLVRMLLLVAEIRRGHAFQLFRPVFQMSVMYLVFLAAAFALSLVALRNGFFLPTDLTFLKQPVWITISRMVEFSIDAGTMLYLIEIFRHDVAALRFTMRVFFWFGVASAVFSIVSFALHVWHIAELGGTYSVFSRMRGFYNEGGPYGNYLLGVLLVGIALYRLEWEKRRTLFLTALPLAIAFFGCQSKAVLFAAATMLALNGLMVKGAGMRLLTVSGLAALLLGVFLFTNVPTQINAIERGFQRYERLSRLRASDPNFVYGRVAGAFIVPRMIAAHPYAGIGWGNYPLVRNDAGYRGAAVFTSEFDAPGLGMLGTLAEFGVPLFLYLLFFLVFPWLFLSWARAPLFLRNLALVQPIVYVFGAQFNLTYPWLVTAFALGLGYYHVQGRPLSGYSLGTADPRNPAVPQPL